MDRPVSLGPLGFPVTVGTTYRLAMWIAAAAFRVLPWNAPGTNDIVGAIRRVWPDAIVFMPLDDLPSDWPKAAGIPADAFLVNAEAQWHGAGVAPAAILMKGFDEPIHVAAVFERDAGAAPTPPPPGSSPPAPTPPADPPRPAPSAPATPRVPAARRGLGGGVAIALGGAALLGVAVVLAHSRGAALARRRVPA